LNSGSIAVGFKFVYFSISCTNHTESPSPLKKKILGALPPYPRVNPSIGPPPSSFLLGERWLRKLRTLARRAKSFQEARFFLMVKASKTKVKTKTDKSKSVKKPRDTKAASADENRGCCRGRPASRRGESPPGSTWR